MIEILFCLILILVTYIYWNVVRPQKRLYDLLQAQGVKGPPFVPIIGQLPQIFKYRRGDNPMGLHQEMAEKYGNTFLLCLGPSMRLVTADPDLLASVLSRANGPNYTKPDMLQTTLTPIIGHKNLLTSEGEEHERARQMINPAFHHVNLKAMVSIITDQVNKAITGLFTDSNSNKEISVDLQLLMNSLTLSIISASAFGSGFETQTEAKSIICKTFNEVFDAIVFRSLTLVNRIPIISSLPICKKNIVDQGAQLVSELVDKIIADRRQGRSSSMGQGTDLLDLLLSAVDDNGRPFTDQEIKDEALTFVLAGSDTTGNLMAWIFSVFMKHENVYQACLEEVDRVLPGDTELTYDHLSQLVICEAIINETLRLHPPAPMFGRRCIRDQTIGSQHPLNIAAGTTVMINSYILHRRSDIWPQPEEFDYTRWLRDPKTGLKPKLPHAYAYLPFASGPRSCIGQNFALLEAKIMLAMFVQRCNFQYVPGQNLAPSFRVTMKLKYGLLAKISLRQKSISETS